MLVTAATRHWRALPVIGERPARIFRRCPTFCRDCARRRSVPRFRVRDLMIDVLPPEGGNRPGPGQPCGPISVIPGDWGCGPVTRCAGPTVACGPLTRCAGPSFGGCGPVTV